MAYNYPLKGRQQAVPPNPSVPTGTPPPNTTWNTVKDVGKVIMSPFQGLRQGLPFGKNLNWEQNMYEKARKKRGRPPYKTRGITNWLSRLIQGK